MFAVLLAHWADVELRDELNRIRGDMHEWQSIAEERGREIARMEQDMRHINLAHEDLLGELHVWRQRVFDAEETVRSLRAGRP